MGTPLEHISTLLLLGGVSGAGNTTALNFISDLGFYAIGNLPATLLPDVLKFSTIKPARFTRTAILLDIDSQANLNDLLGFLRSIEHEKHKIVRVFLDSSPETIIKRYSETRRPHPGFDPLRDKTLRDAIQREKSRLLPFRDIAHFVLDTSELSVHALKRELNAFMETISPTSTRLLRVNFVSFGFKFGLPLDCDLVADVRFLPNPHFIEELRDHTGLEAPVASYVMEQADTRTFIEKYGDLLNDLLPKYAHEGKAYLNIGIGCTGGKHRSVAIAEHLSRIVGANHTDYLVSVKHRDVEK